MTATRRPDADPESAFSLRIVSTVEGDPRDDRVAVVMPMTIGRSTDCEIVVPERNVSRAHARVEPAPGGVRVLDLDSSNGVWLDDARVGEAVIEAGRAFRIGATLFTCCAPAAADRTQATAAAAGPIRIRILSGGEAGAADREHVFDDGPITIGRSAECSLTVREPDLSRQHARLDLRIDGLHLTDLGSTGGTWVDGQQVSTVRLEPGQHVRLGGRVLIDCRLGEPSSDDATGVVIVDRDATAAVPVAGGTPRVPAAGGAITDPDATMLMGAPARRRGEAAAARIEHEGEPLSVGANEGFLLDDPEHAWYVVSGGLLVFTVALQNGQPTGTRSHFLDVDAGQICFGFDAPGAGSVSGFFAVPRQGTALRRIRAGRLRELAAGAARGAEVARLIDTWVGGVSAALVAKVPSRRVGELLLRPGERTALAYTSKATADSGVAWVDLWSGSVLFNDIATPRFAGRGVLFPITPDSWIRPVSEDSGPLAIRPLRAPEVVDRPEFWAGLTVFHRVVFECQTIGKKLTLADEFVRLEQKARNAEAAEAAAYDAIGSVMAGDAAPPRDQGRAAGEADPVLGACRLVCRVLGLEARAHPGADEDLSLEERVAAIATASGFRTRVVALRDAWYREDNGPLLGLRAESHHPVALLPSGPRSYDAVDPQTGVREPVDESVAASLSGFAHAFYRTLPGGAVRLSELVRFGARGIGADLKWVLAMAIVVGLFGTVTPFLTGRVFDAAIPQADRRMLLGFGAALVIAAAAGAAFKITQGVATIRIQTRMSGVIQSAVWDRILNLPTSFFRQYPAGDLADRAQGVDAIQNLVAGAGVAAVLGSVSGLFYVVQMFSFNLRLALLAIALTAVYVAVTFGANYLQLRYQRAELQLRGRITGLVLNLVTGVTKIRVCGAEHHAFRAWAEPFARQRRITFTVGTIQNIATVFTVIYPVISSMAIFATMLSIQEGATANAERMTTGDFIAFNAAYALFLMAMQALGDASLSLLRVVPIYERLKPILETPTEVDATKAYPGRLRGRIELSHVYFRYDQDGPWIIKDVSLVIEPGEFVAFVGSSGGGKSTLLRLMLGFEQPTRGTVLYDGQDLSALDMRMVRQQLGVVLQTSRVMPTEIYRNIIGVTSRTIDDAWDAAEGAGLAEDIRNMPMGMHTYVSEGGGTLSGGQRQRLMIARAIVNKPKILFLDEATSALDNRAQAIVTESMARMEATRIVIAHRLSTVENANRICYLHGGSIVEEGTHQQLMARDGLFAQLARRQMA